MVRQGAGPWHHQQVYLGRFRVKRSFGGEDIKPILTASLASNELGWRTIDQPGYAARRMEALIPAFLLALLAQPGDRPALVTAILADRFARPWTVALAAGVAHAIGSVLAALAGAAIGPTLTPEAQSLLLAVALLAGAITGMVRTTLASRLDRWRFGPVLTPLLGVFVLALGEQTQFFTFALAAGGAPWMAAIGTTLGALVVAAIAATLGEAGWRRLPLRWLRHATSAIFLGAGIVIGLGALRLTS
jgi:putative Ca2+/H+ antiporter (TMEM165/GDT1 family)